jgi:hypothetical protein
MIARGHVRNGVVVLDDDVRLAEGLKVTVMPSEETIASEGPNDRSKPHGILDIPPVRLGAMLRAFGPEDDLLGEMLEGR